jgi:hypothetical protein
MMSNFIYAESADNPKNRRPARIERLDDTPDLFGTPATEQYHSIYRFDSSIIEHTQRTGTIAGYAGACRAVGLHFDFDGATAQADVCRFYESVCTTDGYGIGIDDIRIFFSGNKGFHVLVHSDEISFLPPTPAIPDQVKKICAALAGQYQSFDKSVYDKTRLWRMINSRHPKSGLFKIPLFASEIWTHTPERIREIARNQRSISDTATIHQFVMENVKYAA